MGNSLGQEARTHVERWLPSGPTPEAGPVDRRNRAPWAEVVHSVLVVGGVVVCMRLCLHYLDPYREQREQAKKRAAFLRSHLGVNVHLNEYEQLLAANVMNPDKIDVNLDEVSGLDDIIEEMEVKVLAPLLRPDMYCTTLWRQTKGVLLYGPPGTGKTMLAKALAKESGFFFLNLTTSAVLSKWLGDANRLVRAVFTLAEKLQPCIIFIDEVDALLGKRGLHSEHESSLQLKTEFMQLWDGMESVRGMRIVVMGATNRPWMVDEAVLRRFSLQYEIGLPDVHQRAAIIRGYIRRHHAEVGAAQGGVSEQLLDNRLCRDGQGSVDWLAAQTSGYSGSDLQELCAQAAQRVLGEFWAQHRLAAQRGESSSAAMPTELRPVELSDFEAVLGVMRPATDKAGEYKESLSQSSGGQEAALELLRFLKVAMARGSGAGSSKGSGNGGSDAHS